MDSRFAINPQPRSAEQFRQLTRGAAAQKIHLEKSILRVQETHGPVQIRGVLRANRRHAKTYESLLKAGFAQWHAYRGCMELTPDGAKAIIDYKLKIAFSVKKVDIGL